jgi:hypothetical protein
MQSMTSLESKSSPDENKKASEHEDAECAGACEDP